LFGKEQKLEDVKRGFWGWGNNDRFWGNHDRANWNLGKAAYVFQDALAPLLPSLVGSLPPPLQVLIVGLAAIIVAANAFWLQPGNVNALTIQNAFGLYMKSSVSDQVRAAVLDAFLGHAGPYDTTMLVQIVLNNHADLESKPSGSMPGPSSVA